MKPVPQHGEKVALMSHTGLIYYITLSATQGELANPILPANVSPQIAQSNAGRHRAIHGHCQADGPADGEHARSAAGQYAVAGFARFSLLRIAAITDLGLTSPLSVL